MQVENRKLKVSWSPTSRTDMRETITTKSIKRLKKLSKSKSCKTEWRKHDRWCKFLGVVRYSADFVLWTKEKFVNMERRTREIVKMPSRRPSNSEKPKVQQIWWYFRRNIIQRSCEICSKYAKQSYFVIVYQEK